MLAIGLPAVLASAGVPTKRGLHVASSVLECSRKAALQKRSLVSEEGGGERLASNLAIIWLMTNEKNDPTGTAQNRRNQADSMCARPYTAPSTLATPHAPAIYPAAVYRCASPEQAKRTLNGVEDGFVYQRDGHPNATMLAERCRELHRASWATVTSSGMSALAAAILSQVTPEGHIVASNQLYGRSWQLIENEARRMNIEATLVNTTDLSVVRKALRPATQLVVVETISNPLLRLANIQALAELVATSSAKLLVDNTFATPLGCRPLELGADLVTESVSKIMNGHSDVMLGMLAGRHEACYPLARDAISIWGLNSSPFDCWLAARGLSTLHLRFGQACENALRVAQLLSDHPKIQSVHYPGLAAHPDAELASQMLTQNGWVVTFELKGGLSAVERFLTASSIFFCPSLGEVDTTLSHPASTSHRGLSAEQQVTLGIAPGTIRLSVGTESGENVLQKLRDGLAQS